MVMEIVSLYIRFFLKIGTLPHSRWIVNDVDDVLSTGYVWIPITRRMDMLIGGYHPQSGGWIKHLSVRIRPATAYVFDDY